MQVGDSLESIAAVVVQLESEGATVHDVSLSDVDRGDRELTAELCVRVTFGAAASPAANEDDTEPGRAQPGGGRPSDDATTDDTDPAPGSTTPEEPTPPDDGDDDRSSSGAVADRGHGDAPVQGTTRGRPPSPAGRESAIEPHEGTATRRSTSGPAIQRRGGDDGEAEPSDAADGSPDGGDRADDGEHDAGVPCRVEACEETFETEHGMKIHATKAHRDDGSGPPPHRDPERLRTVYETCDTFEEMTDALDAGVSTQTVRRSMIEFGVHDPDDPAAAEIGGSGTGPAAGDDGRSAGADGERDDRADGASGGAPGREAADEDDATRAADGSGQREGAVDGASIAGPPELPAGLSIEQVAEAVEASSTLYQVHRALGIEREEARELLEELELLDIVQGRMAAKLEPEEQRAAVRRRLEVGSDGPEW